MMRRWNVMLVDDDALVLKVHGRFFEYMGHDVVMHANPVEAVAQLQGGKHGTDLLVSDFKMPDMDGLELVRMARNSGYVGPVLMLTGYDQGAHVDEVASLGFDVMIKPVRYYELTEYMRNLQKRVPAPGQSGPEA